MNIWTVLVSQGDVVLQNEHVIETLTKVAICADKINSININQGRWVAGTKWSFCKILWILRFTQILWWYFYELKLLLFPLMDSIKFNVAQGKEGIIDFTSGSELLIAKAKDGHLSVVSIADEMNWNVSKLFQLENRKNEQVCFYFSDCPSPQLKMMDESWPSTSCVLTWSSRYAY